MSSAIPNALGVLERGIEDGLHLGAQLYVSLDGEVVVDTAVGQARAGVPMTRDTLICWFSMTKPTVAVSIAQLWERGRLGLDDRVATYVPEFGQGGKQDITIRHLLTHTAGFRSADTAMGPWDVVVRAACEAPLEPGWVPGRTAGYHLTAGMTMAAEVLRRIDGRHFADYVREEVFLPLGMDDCWVGMPRDRRESYGERVGTMHQTASGEASPIDLLDRPGVMAQCSPGGGGRGPMHQLRLLYEALSAQGEGLLGPQTTEAMTARHRAGMVDKLFGVVVDWGLGFMIDGYTYGPHCSPRTFGHGGALSSVAYCDPEFGLVVCAQTNGMPSPEDHQARLHSFSKSLYEDLGILWAGPGGRDKPVARYA